MAGTAGAAAASAARVAGAGGATAAVARTAAVVRHNKPRSQRTWQRSYIWLTMGLRWTRTTAHTARQADATEATVAAGRGQGR